MALTNFIVTVAVVGAGMLLFTTDIRRSGALFRRNARQLRQWLEEDTASAASKSAKEAAPKKLDSTIPKEKPKEDNH
ncbi:hypothetical protein GQ55_9G097800 [Panicum hallii var. hallii]|uniref:Uncharacterized protein n=3 Tax=Panicum sect. Panicum TaxID=2100772 RepID=A0A3L6TIX5_PANMI|nr:uncharacterized protein LOC112876127 [Panicum hallii]PAN45194.1 hypothetical protein PAHAL_9G100800 [Panicum hallii]PUZ37177.1 hypothetical protein GQ55_9G097800 [Panicum hallii var. hallii]RLN17050.1 uncharacterized protein C2845_PM02G04230 [Panicum miliaceum]RLN38694.1 uncharacterized protein C2845_PM01G29290 [Panicum miliaceum]